MLKLSNEEIELARMLESATGARAKDVVVINNTIVFVVRKGDLGRAVGRQGTNLEMLRRSFGKNVEFIEHSEKQQQFLANVFRGVVFLSVEEKEFNGKKTIFLKIEAKYKGRAIGRGGEKINRARVMLKRHFNYDDLKIL